MTTTVGAASARGAGARRWLAVDLAVALVGLAAIVAWEASGLDIVVTRAFGTPAGFAWRDHGLTSTVLHGGARTLAWVLLGALLVSAWRPWGALRQVARRDRLWIIGIGLLCAALIPILKHFSATSCPWELAEFGDGVARYVPHWVLGVVDGGPGGCFPSGHATTAFAFFAAWFVLRDAAPAGARRWLWATLAAGAVLGTVQVMRGAHHPSHSMWTAWICWTLSAAMLHLRGHLQQRLRRYGHAWRIASDSP